MPQELVDRLQKFCETNQIRRLAAGEIAELLADGEDPGWIAEQASGNQPEARQALSALLAELAPQLRSAPPPTDAQVEDTGDLPAPDGAAVAAAPASGAPIDLEAQLASLGRALPAGVDAEQLQQLLSSPRGMLLADFAAYCQERGLVLSDRADKERIRGLHEEWLQTPRDTLEGQRPSQLLPGGRLMLEKVETFRRDQPKVGRNDPCPCGSGRKFKKCCGRQETA